MHKLVFLKQNENRFVLLAQAHTELLAQWGALEDVNRDEILRRIREGDAVVIDVRPVEEYRTAHLPRAVSLPLAELETRIAELPPDREIVAYCRGPYCVLALEAAKILCEKGYHAARLDLSVWDWRAMGLPLEGEANLTGVREK